MSQVRFKRLHPKAVLPVRAKAGDAGLDLCTVEAVVLAPGSRGSVATGLAAEIPDGYAGLVLPRSGLALRNGIGLVNSPGLIDSGYRGEICVLLLNTDPDETFEASPGERIAQLLIVSYPALEPVWAEELSTTERGEGGFGSTGVESRSPS